MKVIVEQRHIDAGSPCTEACPVALAILAAVSIVPSGQDGGWLMRPLPRVYVCSSNAIIVWPDGTEKNIALPAAVSAIIDAYDDGGTMYPFGFEL